MNGWAVAQSPIERLPDPLEIPVASRVAGSVRPPSSKSFSHRFLNLGLLLGSPLMIEQPLWAEDIELFVAALRTLGVNIDRDLAGSQSSRRQPAAVTAPPDQTRDSQFGGSSQLTSLRLGERSPQAGEVRVDCGNAGTMFRFLTASLCAVPGRFVVDGTERLRERPIGPLVEALRQLGGQIEYLGTEGFAPLGIEGSTLRGGACSLDAGASSQYLSALLMAGLRARSPVRIEVRKLTSAPYVALTLTALEAVGIAAPLADQRGYTVLPLRADFEPRAQVRVEPDWSAAAYPAAAAALVGGPVRVLDVERQSTQGDRRIIDVLEEMGALVEWRDDGIEVRRSGRLRSAELDLGSMPDQVPTVAALAAFAEGRTRIVNVAHLRIKESDRLRAMALGLRKLGFSIAETEDGLVIDGCGLSIPGGTSSKRGTVVSTYNDHRIAMSFSLVGLRRAGTRIAAPQVVGKSYPGFFRDLFRLLSRCDRE